MLKKNKITKDQKEWKDQELGIVEVSQGKIEIPNQSAILNNNVK